MQILIADKVSRELVKALEALGAQIRLEPDLNEVSLPKAIGDAAVLIVRSTRVTEAAIRAAGRLGLIVRAGAGVNTIDLDAASARGIYVSNCPGMNTDAVAEITIGLLIAADRGIADATEALRSGRWQKGRFGKARGLKGRTLGIVGAGQIGKAVAVRARALEMKVIAWSRSLSPEKAEYLGVGYAPTLKELAEKSDAVSVHVAAARLTRKLIGREFFEAMRPGTIFVNTSRGDVVDTEALAGAIRTKGLRVGLDVFESEPGGSEAAFEQTALASQCICTPHIGASTEQAEEAISGEVLRIVREYMLTGDPPNAVNLREPIEQQTHLKVRHYNRVGVLARVLNLLRDEGVNIEEMHNAIFETNATASATLALDKQPDPATIQKLAEDADIIEVRS